MTTDYIKELCEAEKLGKLFEDYAADPCTVALSKRLEEKAVQATEDCLTLSPFSAQVEMAEAQMRVRIYRGLAAEIQGFISEGRNATATLNQIEAGEE